MTERSRRVGLNDLHLMESRTTVLEVKERDSGGQKRYSTRKGTRKPMGGD